MKLFKFVLQYSQKLLILAVTAGVISGVCTTGLLVIINAAVTHSRPSGRTGLYLFIACAASVPLSRALSELLLLHLGQRALFSVRTELSRQVLDVPLQDLEAIGTHKTLAVLTEDIPTLTNLISMIPLFCINTAVVLACLVYMVWLSAVLAGATLVFIVLGILTYQFSVLKAARH